MCCTSKKVTYNDHLVQLPDHFRDDQKLKPVIRGTVQYLLNIDRFGALTTSPGHWCLTTVPPEKCLLMSSLNLHKAALNQYSP